MLPPITLKLRKPQSSDISITKWSERPLLIVVRGSDSQDLTAKEMLSWFDGKIAKWWTPDAVEFIDELPHTATGKVQKVKLREMFKDYVFEASEA